MFLLIFQDTSDEDTKTYGFVRQFLCRITRYVLWYIEDINFFEVNTKNISSHVLKISAISLVLSSTSEIADIFNT